MSWGITLELEDYFENLMRTHWEQGYQKSKNPTRLSPIKK
jgi:hypothetical protein